MARRPRIEFENAFYHVANYGDHREPVFSDDDDRQVFINTLGEACSKTGWIVHAFCLLTDHFHLVINTPQPNLVVGMKWLLGMYARRFNVRHHIHGHLFAGRYRAQLIEPAPEFLQAACDRVHSNPVRSKLIPRNMPIQSYPWSSLKELLRPAIQRPAWLKPLPQASSGVGARIEKSDDESTQYAARLRGGWCLGSDSFKRTIAERLSGRLTRNHVGSEIQINEEAKAERLVQQCIQKLGWDEDILVTKRKGDPTKLEIAKRLREESTMTLEWIARRLKIGTKTHLSHLLYWNKRKHMARSLRVEASPNASHNDARQERHYSSILLTDPIIDRMLFD